MIRRIIIAALALLGIFSAVALAAFAPGSPMVPYTNPDGPMQNGGLSGPMVPNGVGSPPPPVTCDGTVDLSSGCAQPMLGGA